MAQRFGITPLVIGLTVVAFGTSAPELAASLNSALHGHTDLALGNVVGSNICNIGLILGCTTLVMPIPIRPSYLRLEIPFLLLVSAILYALAWTGAITQLAGFFLVALFVAFVFYCLNNGKAENLEEISTEGDTLSKSALLVVIGLIALAGGSEVFVRGAVALAYRFGLSEAVVGLTVVSVGSSLPELLTCVVAAKKGHSDLAFGNAVGSNIQNILIVLGLTGILAPFKVVVPAFLYIDIPVMLGITITLYLMALSKKINRTNGAILLCIYGLYIVYQLAS